MSVTFPSIAITGFGFVTPVGIDPKTAVEAIRRGETGIRPVNLDGIFPILMGMVDQPQLKSYGAELVVDYTLAAAKAAWAESGIGQPRDPWMVATVVGSSKGRIGSEYYTKGLRAALNINDFPGETLGTKVAREMQFSGPVLCYPAACATGIHGIIRAAQLLQTGDADAALAGTGEAKGRTLVMAGFKNMGALSAHPIKPYDKNRSGFNPGEGVAIFVLEREDDARSRGARIIARIAGWDQRSDAHHMTSADPSGDVLAHSIRRSLKMAGWTPEEIQYINAHGTGTQLNDIVEGRSIAQVFGKNNPPVSSLKPNIGHLLGASAAVELALTIACLQDGFIPPTLGLTDPDPDIPLQFVPPNGINQNVQKFMKLSLGFGGHIGVLAIELPGSNESQSAI